MATQTVTPKQAAALLGGLTRQRVQQMVADGTLKTEGKFGSTTMIILASVNREKRRRNGTKHKPAKKR